jgi:hypothetical protein
MVPRGPLLRAADHAVPNRYTRDSSASNFMRPQSWRCVGSRPNAAFFRYSSWTVHDPRWLSRWAIRFENTVSTSRSSRFLTNSRDGNETMRIRRQTK